MLVIGRMMRRDRDRKARMITAMLACGKRLALHHRYLVLVLMDAIMDDVVDPGFGAQIAGFELIHIRLLGPRRPQGAMARRRFIRNFPARRSREQQQQRSCET